MENRTANDEIERGSRRRTCERNHGRYVYWDHSLRWRVRHKDGSYSESYHACWRAEISVKEEDGTFRRIRKRFLNYQEARLWIRTMMSKDGL